MRKQPFFFLDDKLKSEIETWRKLLEKTFDASDLMVKNNIFKKEFLNDDELEY